MNETAIYFKKTSKDTKTPEYAHKTDAACDLATIDEFEIAPMERVLADVGFNMAIPVGVEGQIRPRSGQAWKRGLTIINAPGTIDCKYRGPVKVALINLGNEVIKIKKGERIAQMKFSPVIHGNWIETTDLDSTTRGSGGFGSTGRY